MSSHHFVKEGQELPLIVLGWNSELADIASQLLGWQPLFVVEERFVEHVLCLDLKPDVILGSNNKEFFDDLTPIDFWQEIPRGSDDQYMVLTSWRKQECVDWVLSYNDIIYTETHKYYKSHSLMLKIWLPKNSSIEIFDIQKDEFELFEVKSEGFFEKEMGIKGFILIERI